MDKEWIHHRGEPHDSRRSTLTLNKASRETATEVDIGECNELRFRRPKDSKSPAEEAYP